MKNINLHVHPLRATSTCDVLTTSPTGVRMHVPGVSDWVRQVFYKLGLRNLSTRTYFSPTPTTWIYSNQVYGLQTTFEHSLNKFIRDLEPRPENRNHGLGTAPKEQQII